MDAGRDLVQQVLQGLDYPAEKWQIVTQAELYGADVKIRNELYELPMGEYRSAAEIVDALGGGSLADNGSRAAQQA